MHLLETLARWAWQTSLAASILIIPALLAQSIFRKPALTPIRHLLGLLIVARLLLPFTPPSPFSVFNLIPQHAQQIPVAPVQTEAPVVTFTHSAPPITNNKFSIFNFQYLIPILWLIGVTIILVRVLHQHTKIRRALRHSKPTTSGPVADAFAAAAKLTNFRRPVAVHALPNLPTPALFGIIRPVILVPADLLETANPHTLKLIFLHELAHVARRDIAVNWLAIIAQSLHWFNPLVWLALRRLRAEQELLCDADVMRRLQPDERQSYGETLLSLASSPANTISTALPISTGFKQMKERIAMITQFKPTVHRFLVYVLPALAVAIALVTFTTAAAKKPAKAPPSVPTKTGAHPNDGLEKLKNELEQLNVRVAKMQAEIDDRGRMLGIVDGETPAEAFADDRENVKFLERERIRVDQELISQKMILKDLKAQSRENLRHSLPTVSKDEALIRLAAETSKADQQLVVMLKDYSDEHPEVVRLAALKKNLDKQIEQRIDGILSGMDTLVHSRQAIVDNLRQSIDESKERQASLRDKSRGYFDSKRTLEALTKMRDSIYIRILQETVDMNATKAK